MRKIGIILPYFGNLPEYFDLFLKSCGNNYLIDWLIFTDSNKAYSFPNNVFCFNCSFLEFKEKIQNKFDFQICLDAPYKLCDFKPSYGYVLSEYLIGYDYWGYCDCDLIFGDLSHFVLDSKIEMYDKVGHLGHFSLYRNDNTINQLFMSSINGCVRYKEVFSTPEICVFDEWGKNSINEIFFNVKKNIWIWNDFYDIYPYNDNYVRAYNDVNIHRCPINKCLIGKVPSLFLFKKGRIYGLYKQWFRWEQSEYGYVHFQKRKVQIDYWLRDDAFLLTPWRFEEFSEKKKSEAWKRCVFHKFINKRGMCKIVNDLKYYFIETTGPVRHKIREVIHKWKK